MIELFPSNFRITCFIVYSIPQYSQSEVQVLKKLNIIHQNSICNKYEYCISIELNELLTFAWILF